MSEEHEIMIWLAGLISTDGCVGRHVKTSAVRFSIASSEKDWLEQIQKKLASIGIDSYISTLKSLGSWVKPRHVLYLRKADDICCLFQKHHLKDYTINRKWKIIKDALEYYDTDTYKRIKESYWNETEASFLKENYLGMTDEALARQLDRNKRSILDKRYRLALYRESDQKRHPIYQIICESCGKKVRRSPSLINRAKHHFCSRKCRREWFTTDAIDRQTKDDI